MCTNNFTNTGLVRGLQRHCLSSSDTRDATGCYGVQAPVQGRRKKSFASHAKNGVTLVGDHGWLMESAVKGGQIWPASSAAPSYSRRANYRTRVAKRRSAGGSCIPESKRRLPVPFAGTETVLIAIDPEP